MHSSTSLSVTSTVVQLISSRAGKGWYVTFISSFSTPGMSNLAVTCCAEKQASKCSLDEHVDRCNPHPGAIRGIPELHTTRNVVVSVVRAHMRRRELTLIVASSKEVPERALAQPLVPTVAKARF
jgi:hypothetical protein